MASQLAAAEHSLADEYERLAVGQPSQADEYQRRAQQARLTATNLRPAKPTGDQDTD
ncbi:hypothetical protein [Streptomyces sp. NPDC001492]